MNKDKDWREVVINIVLIGGSIVGGLFGLGYLAGEFGDHVVRPIIHAINVYVTNYWRGTAEIFSLVTASGIGIRFHDKIVRSLSQNFVEHAESQAREIEKLTSSAHRSEKEAEKARLDADELRKQLGFKDTKIKMMRDESLVLQDEILRLKDPEGMARKEVIEEKKVNESQLKEIADSIRWGSV